MAAQLVAGKCAGHPMPAPRWRDVLRIQLPDDLPGIFACRKVPVNAPHDFGLFLDDLELARPAEHRAIAIGFPAGMAAVARDAFHATPNLVRQVLQIERPNKTANADLHLIRHAVMHGADLNAGEGEPLINARKVLLVARKPVQGFHDQDIELPGAGRFHHCQKAIATHDRCAGAGAIIELCDNLQTGRLGVATAKGDLIFNGSIALQIR